MGAQDPCRALVERLEADRDLTGEELRLLLTCPDLEVNRFMAERARGVRERYYGRDVYLRGLIEFTSYCKNNCRYCGIRRGNARAERCRLSREEILACAETGWRRGFRTFVLQGGEDPYFTDERLCDIVEALKRQHPEAAITLSVGERDRQSYQRLYDAGAERYLLRHETANRRHYELLHPEEMSYERRMQCLRDLREIGYQVGCGMMVGSPGQTTEHLVEDLRFLQQLQPEMVGIGPFIPHHDTEYAAYPAGSAALTLRLLSVIRLMLPRVLLPATTALGTVDPMGREKGLEAGANVVMPNLSPTGVREKYMLYDNKICTGEAAAECIHCISRRAERAGCRVVVDRGDPAGFRQEEKC